MSKLGTQREHETARLSHVYLGAEGECQAQGRSCEYSPPCYFHIVFSRHCGQFGQNSPNQCNIIDTDRVNPDLHFTLYFGIASRGQPQVAVEWGSKGLTLSNYMMIKSTRDLSPLGF